MKKMRKYCLILCLALLLTSCGAGSGTEEGDSAAGDASDSVAGSAEGESSAAGDSTTSSLEGDLNGDGQVNIMDDPAYAPGDRQVLRAVISMPFRDDLDRITAYNASSSSYFIELINYGGGVDSFETLETQLALDVLSGEGPDLVIWGSIDYSPALASGRLMEDLNQFMDADPDFHREDYYENILEAFEIDGGLYLFPVTFNIHTGCVRAEEFEAGRGVTETWTLEEMINTYENRKLAALFTHNYTQQFQIRFITEDCMENFVDWGSGECHFDSPEFVKLLEWCKTFPEQWQDESFYEEYTYPEAQRAGVFFWLPTEVTDPLTMAYQRISQGDADLLWPGHPVPDGGADLGGGVAAPGRVSFSICKNSGNQEAAWDFIKSWLTEDMQREMRSPILKSASEEQMRGAMTMEYEIVDGVEQEKPKYEVDTVVAELPGGVIEWETTSVYVATEEDVAVYRSILENTHRSYGNDPGILDIIEEEAGAYFAGDKDAATVADIIQHRVSIYVSERMN
ncbi:MAG: extracellular solute-binding protein [Candidatus Gastranaerophilales bacterium]|nr:extracellular solute-binding protein [Candidatus Gastranaerophilales bacterium]